MRAEKTGLELTLAPRAVQLLLAHRCLLPCIEPKRQQCKISYFDTPDLALQRAQFVLRQDQDGDQRRLTATSSSTISGRLAEAPQLGTDGRGWAVRFFRYP